MLEIRLLGQFEVARDGKRLEIVSRPSRMLFAYLALSAGTLHPRERVAGLLWPESDESSARGNLRQALWRLRKALGEGYLLVDNNSVAFDLGADYWLDTAFLEAGGGQELAEAVGVYKGELLPGHYEEWVLLERERLQALFERQIQRLLEKLQFEEQWPEIIKWAERWIAFGQTPEPAYRALMVAHTGQGDLAAAAKAYERCVAALAQDIGVEPSQETRDLYVHLLEGKALPVSAHPATTREARHNLPYQSMPFIGRESELVQVRELLSGTRLLTIAGPGGTGKTRLALQAAGEMVEEFANGAYFVSLAPLEDDQAIVQAISETIGFPLSSNEDPQRQLLRHLRRRQYLLILDNFEHLLSGASLVSEILRIAGQVKIIVTSREKLNLREETLIRIEGLAYPLGPATPDALDYGAVRLFVDSARHARPDFTLTANNLPHIIDICRMLQGMPLGILLAAAWAELLTTEEIASEIGRSIDFLQAEWRDAPDRHHSVRAAFDPSWRRLSARERELFASLAVFRGGFSREAAESVAGATLRDLAGLVNKSLLRRDLETGRYEMHELLRQYAREHLEQMPEAKEIAANAHAVYFANFMHAQWRRLIGSEQLAAAAAIDADLENLRRSWRFWLERRSAAHLRMYVDAYRWIYDWHGWNKTGVELFGGAVAALRPDLGTANEELQIAFAELLAEQAYFLANLGDADSGLELARESVAILKRLERYEEMAIPSDMLQYNAYYIEDREQVVDQDLRHAIAYGDDGESRWKWAFHTAWRGRAFAWRGDYEQARRTAEQSLQMFEQLGDNLGTIWPRLELGHMAVMQGDFLAAQEQYAAVLDSALTGYHSWSKVKANRYLGNIATILGDYQEAKVHLLASLRHADELGMIRDVVSALYDMATVEAGLDNRETAVRLFALVRQHPLSHHTRTFSLFSGDPVVRFNELAENQLAQLREQLPAGRYAAALAEGEQLKFETAVLQLLSA